MLLGEIKSNNLITKSNSLIQSRYNLTANEQKILLGVISIVEPKDEDFKPIQLNIEELSNLLDTKHKGQYTEIKKIYEKLTKKDLFIKDDEGNLVQTRWFSSITYLKNGKGILLRFDPSLKPFLLELKSHFTKYQLKNILKLNSAYSIRIFELLKQYEKIGIRTFDLNEIKETLGIEDKYKAYKDFKRRVILQSQVEINNKTDINFEFEEIKNGKKVEKIKFIIKSKKVCPIECEDTTKKESKGNELELDLQVKFKIDTLKSIIEHEISEKEILSILNSANGDIGKIIEKYYIVKNKKDITNFVGLMIDSIKNDYKELKVQNKDDKINLKTKFHNLGEERFKKYSEEEFEKIALENNKKKFGA